MTCKMSAKPQRAVQTVTQGQLIGFLLGFRLHLTFNYSLTGLTERFFLRIRVPSRHEKLWYHDHFECKDKTLRRLFLNVLCGVLTTRNAGKHAQFKMFYEKRWTCWLDLNVKVTFVSGQEKLCRAPLKSGSLLTKPDP